MDENRRKALKTLLGVGAISSLLGASILTTDLLSQRHVEVVEQIINKTIVQRPINQTQVTQQLQQYNTYTTNYWDADAVVYTKDGNYYAVSHDGTTICTGSPTACLQEAVNYVAQFGGGRIFIRRGTYYPSNTVYLPDNVYIEIHGDGNETVFSYTGPYLLFLFEPSTPSWNAVFRFRDFKIDRSQSGSNNTDILDVVYAKYVEVNNVEVVDNFRTASGNDCAICLYNNITAIVEKCRVYNKSYGITVGGYLSIARDNYVVNTYAAGIVAQGFTEGSQLPPGYSYGGLSIIEDNTCIDCGRGDEAISIDYGAATASYGSGIIRGNRIITMNYTTNHMVTAVNAAKVIIEDNVFEGTVTGDVAANIWGKSGIIYLAFRNNIANVIYNGSVNSFITSDYTTTIIEDNKINITYTNITSNPSNFFNLYLRKLFVRNNSISVSMPNGILISNIVNGNLFGTDTEPTLMVVDDNSIYINGSVNKVIRAAENNSYSVGKPYVVITNNNINGASSNFLQFLIRIEVYGNVEYARIFGNNTNGTPSYNIVGLWTNTSSASIYLDTDIPSNQIGSYSTFNLYWLKRNSGTATIASGSTSVTVNHGLVCTPSRVLITPLAQPSGNLWVSNITSTSFTINISSAPSVNLPVAWLAEC